jgi:hypothetical protein
MNLISYYFPSKDTNPNMKMMSLNPTSKRFLGALAILLAGFTTACNKEDDTPNDTQAPTIENLMLNNKDHDVTIEVGANLVATAVLKDNLNLGEAKIDIHSNFDGHSHGRVQTTPFDLSRVIRLSGTQMNLNERISIPADAATGNYHFILQIIDAAGNEGDFAEIEFEITGSSQPQIKLTAPKPEAGGDEIELAKGGTLRFAGMVEDADGLAELKIKIEEDGGHSHGRIEAELGEPFYEKEYELNGVTTFDLSNVMPIVMPNEHADLVLYLTAFDTKGNTKTVKLKLHVH